MPAAMVAEPGNAPHGTGLPAAGCAHPPPTLGPYEPGGSSPGRWSQVQRLGDFVNGLARKLETWASDIGLWQRTTDDRLTTTDQRIQRLDDDVRSMKGTIEAEIGTMKSTVETEVLRKQADLETLSRES